jgi:zinc transporter ZupT
MSVLTFLKNNKKDLLRAVAVLMMAAFAAALIFVFSKTVLPEAEEQNAFGTVYAVDDSE